MLDIKNMYVGKIYIHTERDWIRSNMSSHITFMAALWGNYCLRVHRVQSVTGELDRGGGQNQHLKETSYQKDRLKTLSKATCMHKNSRYNTNDLLRFQFYGNNRQGAFDISSSPCHFLPWDEFLKKLSPILPLSTCPCQIYFCGTEISVDMYKTLLSAHVKSRP